MNTLIPFWDLANHANGEISTDYESETNSVICMANHDFKADEQFTIFYGKRSNHDLLIHNGFVLENNLFNSVAIKLGISKNDSLALAKQELLQRLSISPQGMFAILQSKEGSLDSKLLAFLRVMVLKEANEVEEWAKEENVLTLLNEKTKEDLDKRAMQYLQTRCNLLLRSYPTTLEEDAEIYDQNMKELTVAKRSCLILRKAEKEILNQVIRYCQRNM